MTQTLIYKYLGTNGTIESPVHLEGIYSVQYYQLRAEAGNILTDGKVKVKSIKIPVDELNKWTEISE